MRRPRPGWLLFATSAIAAPTPALLTKSRIFERLAMPGDQPALARLPGLLTLRTNLHERALFGTGQGLGLVFAGMSFVALTGIGIMVGRICRPGTCTKPPQTDLWSLAALGLITGGILGNLYDRLGLRGLSWHAPPERFGEPVRAVRDWIHFALEGVIDWPIFNLADSYLVVGAGILVIVSLIQPRHECSDTSETTPSP